MTPDERAREAQKILNSMGVNLVKPGEFTVNLATFCEAIGPEMRKNLSLWLAKTYSLSTVTMRPTDQAQVAITARAQRKREIDRDPETKPGRGRAEARAKR